MRSYIIKRFSYGLLATAAILQTGVTAGDEVIDWSEVPDFDEIRMQRGARADVTKSCESSDEAELNKQITSYVDDEDWESAAQTAEVLLQLCPLDITVHMYAGIAPEQRGSRISWTW